MHFASFVKIIQAVLSILPSVNVGRGAATPQIDFALPKFTVWAFETMNLLSRKKKTR